MKNARTVGLRIVSQMVSLSTLGVRDFSGAVSGFGHCRHRSIQPRARKKPLVPKVVVVVVCTLDFLKSFNFCLGWLCHFKGLFTPVGREIHRSKIATVTS